MSINLRGRVVPLLAISALALGVAACGDDDDDDSGDTGNGGGNGDTSMYEDLSGTLEASGASFPDAYYQAAIAAFADVAPEVVITYNPTGSGTGKQQFGEGLTDFAGSDSLVEDELGPDEFYYVPTVAAPITVSYNVPGVENLQLSPETVADIFQSQITTWDDPAIAEDNPDAELPSTDITVAHRSDGSGTTSNFTSYLDKAADNWTLGAGDTVEWASDTQGGEGNPGVAQIVESTEGAIGYVDLADANETGLATAAIRNQDGNFVAPSLEGTTAGLDGAEVNEDLTYDPLNAAGPDAYPITAPTYILVKSSYDAATADLVKGFVTWLLTDGAALAQESDFAPLPDSLREQALGQLDKIEVM